jgi:hypothetical protein
MGTLHSLRMLDKWVRRMLAAPVSFQRLISHQILDSDAEQSRDPPRLGPSQPRGAGVETSVQYADEGSRRGQCLGTADAGIQRVEHETSQARIRMFCTLSTSAATRPLMSSASRSTDNSCRRKPCQSNLRIVPSSRKGLGDANQSRKRDKRHAL